MRDLTGYEKTLIQIESGGNPNARNPSGASGLYQFMPATWRGLMGSAPMSAENQKAAFDKLTAGNLNYLRGRLGREPEDWELYLAHQQGGGGAARLLTQAPNARLERNQLANNPMRAANIGDWLAGWQQKWSARRAKAATPNGGVKPSPIWQGAEIAANNQTLMRRRERRNPTARRLRRRRDRNRRQ